MFDSMTIEELRQATVNQAVAELSKRFDRAALLTPEQVAALWGVCAKTVARSGLSPVLMGKIVRYRLSDVISFVENQPIQNHAKRMA